jgi:hypothetical protein
MHAVSALGLPNTELASMLLMSGSWTPPHSGWQLVADRFEVQVVSIETADFPSTSVNASK